MPEPTNPTPPEPNPTPPAPTPADNNTPLGVANSNGWRTVGDVIASFNDVSGKLANPQAPAQYDPAPIIQHYGAQTDENGAIVKDAAGNPVPVFNAADAEFGVFANALRAAGVSQKNFEKAALAFHSGIAELSQKNTQTADQEALTKVGGQEKLTAIEAAAEKAGLGRLAKMASGDELLVLDRMVSATTKVGGLTPPAPNAPPGAPAQDASQYHPDCQTKIGGEVVGINPASNESMKAFMQIQIGADKDGNGGRPFYKTPAGQRIYAKAQEIRRGLIREGKTEVLGEAKAA